jgi:putative N6-adenine-specific DNA methylase
MEDNFKMVYAKPFFLSLRRYQSWLLGAQNVEQGVRMVSFKGDRFMYKANLALRTALKKKPKFFF